MTITITAKQSRGWFVLTMQTDDEPAYRCAIVPERGQLDYHIRLAIRHATGIGADYQLVDNLPQQ